jgi:WD40 repeat protein
MRTLAVHANHVRCVAYSPDGALLATASNDRSVRVLEAATGKTVRHWADLGGVMQAVCFHPEGSRIAFGGQTDIVRVSDVEAGGREESIRVSLRPLASVTSLVYMPDGGTLLCGTGDRKLRIAGHLYVLDGESLAVPAMSYALLGVQHLAVRPDGGQVALGKGNGWELVDPATWTSSGGGSVGTASSAVAYSPRGDVLAVATGFGIRMEAVPGREFIRYLSGHRGKITSLAFTPEGRKLISGSWDRTVRVWDTASWREESALEWGRGKVQYVATAPDGMTAAAACDKGVVIWDLDG